MNSGDGSKPSDPRNPQAPRPRLHIGGDASGVQNTDRFSTVLVHADEPTPPPSSPGPAPSGRFISAPPPSSPGPAPSGRFISAPPPSSPGPAPSGRFISAPPSGQPQGRGPVRGNHDPYGALGADEPTPPPRSSMPMAPQPRPGAGVPGPGFSGAGGHQDIAQARRGGPSPMNPPRSAYDAEYITSTGFMPPTNFQPSPHTPKKAPSKPASGGKKRWEFSVGKFEVDLSELTWLDDTAVAKRVQYGGGGFLAGAFAGLILGIVNAALQGWDVVDGLGQLLFLAIFVGVVVGVVSAMRPERVDELLSQVSFFSERDKNDE